MRSVGICTHCSQNWHFAPNFDGTGKTRKCGHVAHFLSASLCLDCAAQSGKCMICAKPMQFSAKHQ